MASHTKKRKPFTDLDPMPTDPKRVLEYRWESPGEIWRRTGLDWLALCAAIERWASEGLIATARIECAHCSVPVFKLKQSWEVR